MKDTKVPRVKEFTYLHIWDQQYKKVALCESEVKKRVQVGWNRWGRVSGVICDKKLPARVKRKVYCSVQWSIDLRQRHLQRNKWKSSNKALH